jgi:hypothetical protein
MYGRSVEWCTLEADITCIKILIEEIQNIFYFYKENFKSTVHHYGLNIGDQYHKLQTLRVMYSATTFRQIQFFIF